MNANRYVMVLTISIVFVFDITTHLFTWKCFLQFHKLDLKIQLTASDINCSRLKLYNLKTFNV